MARYRSKHTGKKIDDTIDNVVNPNLLDNWYFGNPVNQRGQTSYTGAGYGIDRWRCVYGSEVVTLGNDNILLTLNNNQAIRQYIEFPSKFEGKTVTISILWEMVEGDYANVYCNTSAGMFAVMSKTEKFNKQISSATGTVQSGVSSLTVDIAGKGKIKVYAVKLELGSQQTLAHQENGVWVLNEIPDYGEQFARCQRYCFVWDYGNTGTSCLAVFQAYTAANAFGIIPTPVTLRANPVVSGGTLVTGGKTVILTGITKCANGIRAIATVSDGNLTVGQAVGIENGNDNDRVVFSADL